VAVSQTGTILFTDGGRAFGVGGGGRRSIVVQSRMQTRWLEVPQRLYEDMRASPDGSKLALTVRDSANAGRSDVWLLTFASGQLKPFTRNGQSSHPVWSPDGKRIIYRVTAPSAKPVLHFLTAPWDESEPPRPIPGLDGAESVEFPEPGGKYMAIVRGDSSGTESASTNSDILIAPLDSPAAARPFASTGIRERMPRFSPDGKWLAYVGHELPSTSGGTAVGSGKLLMRAVPGPPAVTQVSVEDGNTPLWSRDGRTLYYFIGSGGAPLVAARIVDVRGVESPARSEILSRPAPGTGFGSPVAPWVTDMLPNGDVIYLTSLPPPDGAVARGSVNSVQQPPAAVTPKLIAIVNWLGAESAARPPK
jgi:dipeptidyl aminopeptidase/acylaminoacyl peptidase